MTQSNELPSRMNRAEDNIIDLRLAASALLQATDKNSADIAQLIEVTRRNSEGISIMLEVSRCNSEGISTLDEAIRSIQASTERMDRLIDYLVRRDQPQSE